MNTENSMRQHQTLTRMVKLQNTDNSKRSYGGGETGNFIHCYWECRNTLPNSFTSRYLSEKNQNSCPPNTYMLIFRTSLFLISLKWKEPKGPSPDKQLNMWFMSLCGSHEIEHDSAIKRNEVLIELYDSWT